MSVNLRTSDPTSDSLSSAQEERHPAHAGAQTRPRRRDTRSGPCLQEAPDYKAGGARVASKSGFVEEELLKCCSLAPGGTLHRQ